MSISRERFDMALDRMSAGDWQQFENLASIFLASEYPSLRTMASASGDGGRDSELFTDDNETATAIQYSVTSEWKPKIRQTIDRLEETFPDVNQLIYVTNRKIGAGADDLKKELRAKRKFLDVRDRSWFLDRANIDRNREVAAEEVARKFVDPLLPSRDVDRSLVTALDSEDAKMALLYLEMQVQDSNRSLGLTKASFDTLTLAALRDTDTSTRLKRSQIYNRIQQFLPSHPFEQLRMKVDGSLKRLSQKAIRHRKDEDEFHLLDSEILRVKNSISRIDALRRDFEEDLINVLNNISNIVIIDGKLFVNAARRVIETYFLKKGEDFAKAALSSEKHLLDEITLKEISLSLSKQEIGVKGKPPAQLLIEAISTLIATASEATTAYLNLLLQSYTLFAFLAETPDVQRATRNMFGTGEIWLDTSVLLPVLAETAFGENQRPFTEMFKQVVNAGIKLYVSEGVIVEIERHINKSRACARSSGWKGDAPFLFANYAISGGNRASFAKWLERFVGDIDPMQDIADYLRQYHNIILESAASHNGISEALASSIRQVWKDIHFERHERRDGSDLSHALRMAEHDAEMYLHVLSSMVGQYGKSPLGYTCWWLTLDTKARSIMEKIPPEIQPNIKTGPVLSIDYLIRYLALGPARERFDASGVALAKIYPEILTESIPDGLMPLVSELRTEHADIPEHVILRRIRDTLNTERSKSGAIDSGGQINPSDLLDAAY